MLWSCTVPEGIETKEPKKLFLTHPEAIGSWDGMKEGPDRHRHWANRHIRSTPKFEFLFTKPVPH